MTQELSEGSRRASAPPTAKRLRVRIAETRVKQNRVASRLGISESHLSNVLAGRKHTDNGELLVRIAEAIEAVASEAVA